jgi:hypothetical protein
MRAYKMSKPEAANLCLHFATNTCKFGEKCKEKHSEALKKDLLNMLSMSKGIVGLKKKDENRGG